VIERPKEPPKLDDEDDDFGNAFPTERPTTPGEDPEEGVPDERPTVSPPFDVEEYAKQSDSKMRAGRTPSPEKPLPPGVAGMAAKAPRTPDFDLADELPNLPHLPTAPSVERPRPRQVTLTDEGETEEARLRSILMQSDPPPLRSAGAPVDSEQPPATKAYPSEYEKDPFSLLTDGSSEAPGGDDAGRELGDMSDRFSLGDYTGALEIAETVLGRDPSNAEASRCADECRAKLIHMYTARVGPLDRVPVVMVAREQLRWLSIDHRAGFLLSHIDGVSSLEMILDVSGMPLLDALKILAELSQQRVISFR
jgi:hypothetical protein